MRQLILASSSQYRAKLLAQLQLPFSTKAPNIDETPQPGEAPQDLARRLAADKAQALASQYPNALIIGSDQVATLGGSSIGKPGSKAQALKQLKAASGQWMSFYTGLCLRDSGTGVQYQSIESYRVKFKTLTERQIERYLSVDAPYDCAGSFKCEAYGIALFEAMEGRDHNSLIGLPLIALTELLGQAGVDVLAEQT